jgi:hypothetical protein
VSKRALILVEGQTEERFVKDVLGPLFFGQELFLHPTILVTKRVKDGPNFKGGIINFARFKNDAQRLLNSAAGALVTTMVDYYGLPEDFPGMDSRPSHGTAIQRVTHVEDAVAKHFESPQNFLPFFVLHEFEALLFSSLTELPQVLIEPRKKKEFEAIRASVGSPEEINERPDFAPSKRIIRLFPSYKKTVHGPMTAARIGIQNIRAECPHFNGWLQKLEIFAQTK